MVRFFLVFVVFLFLGGWVYFGTKRSYLALDEGDLFLARPRYRILITHKGGIGEQEMAERIKLAGKSLNLECASFPLNHPLFFKRVFPHYKERFATLFHPDIVISLQGEKVCYPHSKHYIALTHGSNYYFHSNAILPVRQLMDFDGFLVSFPDQEKLLSNHNFIQWYSTCGKTEFAPPTHFRLFYCGLNMANTLFGTKYKQLFSRLDKAHYFNVYGKKNEWRHTPNSYRGFIKCNGETLLRTMNNTGVALLLHAPDHFCGQTPTGRIFEAAASSNVIISDRHPFVEKEFGDTVLYIDQDKSSEEIFQQIDGHMRWIQSHPKEAILLAKRSHDIFIKKFTLEKQLENLIELHKRLQEPAEGSLKLIAVN